MAIPDFVQGAQRPDVLLTWLREDGTVEDLTGVSSITGVLYNEQTRTVAAITGSLQVYGDPGNGQFTWSRSAADVATAGKFRAQFTAVFSSGPSPAISFDDSLIIRRRFVAS